MKVVHEEPGKLYLKWWDAWDHHSLILEEGGVGLAQVQRHRQQPDQVQPRRHKLRECHHLQRGGDLLAMDREARALRAGRCRRPQPVGPTHTGPWCASLQHSHLMPQDEDPGDGTAARSRWSA
jgi:hypothetical protein